MSHRILAAVVTAFALGAVVTAMAVPAAIPDAQGVFHACVSKSGSVRLVETSCARTERAVTWNASGPEGPGGPTGPAGPAGAAGLPGLDGERGPSDAYIARNDGPTEILTWPERTTIVTLALPAGYYALAAKAVVVNPSTGVAYQGAAITCRLSTGEYSGAGVDGNEATTVTLQDLLTLTEPGTVTLACEKSYPSDEMHSGVVRMAKITAIQVAELHG